MGGSGGGGGGYFPRKQSAAEVESLVRKAQEQAERDRGEAETNHALLDVLAEFNDRDVDGTGKRLDQVQESLGSEIEVDRILFGGSVAKHTYVDGLSDVDALVVLEDESAADGPEDLKRQFVSLLERRLPMDDVASIEEGTLAVTIRYQDGTELQLLPAKQSGETLAIPSSSGTEWSTIRPKAFAKTLTEVNEAQAGAVIPTIKLAKSLISNLPENLRLTGYHVEALAVETFRGYEGRKTPVAMMRAFFSFASERVRTPIADATGQSSDVDGYLGPSGSTERKFVSDRLATVHRQLRSAASPARWKELVAGE